MKLLKEDQGQTTVLMALIAGTVLSGMLALVVDVGLLYRQRRIVQAAADSGALSAAEGESTSTDITSSATTAATQNGLTIGTGSGQASVTATDGISGTGNTAYVRVTVTAHTPTIFLGILNSGFRTMDVSADAQASYLKGGSSACMTGLSTTGVAVPYASGVEVNGSTNMIWNTTVMSDIATQGNSRINTPNCGIQACGPTSSYYASGSGKTGAGIYAWGSGNITASSTSSPSYGTDNSGSTISPKPTAKSCSGDPLASTMPAAPSTSGSCSDPGWMKNGTGGGGTYSISPGTYCNFNTANVAKLTLQPGLYVIKTTFSTNSGTTISGTGVTIYLANGVIANSGNYTYVSGGATPYGVGNGTTMNISAPTSGSYAGIAIWDGNASASTPDTFTFGGGASSTFSGSIYAPNTNLVLGNGSGTSTMSSNIIANTIMILGGSTLQNNYQPANGGTGATQGGVTLAE
jgi:Flp pilus assembly protein TadG